MASFKIVAHDGKKLRIQIPEGTDPADYDSMADDAKLDYFNTAPAPMDQAAEAGFKAAVMPFTAPAKLLASEDPTEMPTADTINTVADRGAKVWHAAGLPARGYEGLTSLATDTGNAIRHGALPPGDTWSDYIHKAADVVDEKKELPGVAGFLAGFADPRYMWLGGGAGKAGEAVASGVAGKAEGFAAKLGERVLEYSRKLVGNEHSRRFADDAAHYAVEAHPEIQQAIMDVAGFTPNPKAAASVESKAAEKIVPASESIVKPPAPSSEMGGISSTEGISGPPALPQLKAPTPGEPYLPGSIRLGPEGSSGAGVIPEPKNPYIPPGERVIPPTRLPDKTELIPGTDFTLVKPKPPEGPMGLSVQNRGISAEKPPVLKGEAPEQGVEKYEQMANTDKLPEAPEGIDSLGVPTVRWGAEAQDMYDHVQKQLDTVGDAMNVAKAKLSETGELVDGMPFLRKIQTMFQRDGAGKSVDAMDLSLQGENNLAVQKVINTINHVLLDKNLKPRPLDWEEANRLKTGIQGMANYLKPKDSAENMVYKRAAAILRDEIDTQAAKVMRDQGGDIGPFQALRGAYSNLKVLEETLNNKYATEKSRKSLIPVLRTVGTLASVASKKFAPGMTILADYLVRQYGPQIGADMASRIAESSGPFIRGARNVSRGVPLAANAITQGLEGGRYENHAEQK